MNSLAAKVFPCWYELSFLKEEMLILLRIHQDFAKNFSPIPYKGRVAEMYAAQYGFSTFSGNLRENFGFNGSLIYRGKKDQFVEFAIEIPRVKWLGDNDCVECGGSGKRKKPFEEGRCGYCQGLGKQIEDDWKTPLAISASLKLLFDMMDQPPKTDTSASIPQLMTIRLAIGQGQSKSLIWTDCSAPVCNWLLSREDNADITEVNEVVEAVYNKMIFYKKDSRLFSAYVHDGHRPYLRCDGGAVFTDGMHVMRKDEDFRLTSDEIDNPAMQLALLAGLAKLCDMIRNDRKGKLRC